MSAEIKTKFQEHFIFLTFLETMITINSKNLNF